jgi:hypothetical protein
MEKWQELILRNQLTMMYWMMLSGMTPIPELREQIKVTEEWVKQCRSSEQTST